MHDLIPPPTYLSLERLARSLGLPSAWLRDQTEQGTIPHIRIGKRRYFSPPTVERALDVLAAREAARFARQRVSVPGSASALQGALL